MNQVKKCSTCKLELDKSLFGIYRQSKDGLRYVCKNCRKLKEYTPNREKRIAASERWRKSDRGIQKRLEYNKSEAKQISVKKYLESNRYKDCIEKYRNTEAFKESSSRRNKRYYYSEKGQAKIRSKRIAFNSSEKGKKFFREYIFNKRKTSISCRLSSQLWHRFWLALKNNFKNGSAVKDLGCSISEFKLYIENYFSIFPGMSWDNYGKDWHLDHFIPLSYYNLEDRTELLEALHYTNLQPLWKSENIKKHNKLPFQFETELKLGFK